MLAILGINKHIKDRARDAQYYDCRPEKAFSVYGRGQWIAVGQPAAPVDPLTYAAIVPTPAETDSLVPLSF
jgi:hypothetical protein